MLATVYPFVTAFAVLSTGNHFVVDVLGGLLTLALSVALVRAAKPPAPAAVSGPAQAPGGPPIRTSGRPPHGRRSARPHGR